MNFDSKSFLRRLGLSALLLVGCSNGSNNGNDGDGGRPASPTGPGDFSSVWQAASMEVTVFDPANPTEPQQRTIDVPALMKAPTTEKNVELYVTFEGDKRISYARYENTDVYYRITHSAMPFGEGDGAQYSTENDLYTLEEGGLTQTTARESDGKSIVVTTKFRRVAFPPAGWPTEKIDQDAEEDSP